MKTFFDFIDLAPKWEKIIDSAKQRKAKKDGYASGLHYNKFTDLVGLAAEVGYGRLIDQEPNWELLDGGDLGEDFPGVDVKGRSSKNSMLLLEFLDRGKPKPNGKTKPWPRLGFALVAVDEEKRMAWLAGCALTQQMKDAPQKKHGYQGALRYSLAEKQLTKGILLLGPHHHLCPECEQKKSCETDQICTKPLATPCGKHGDTLQWGDPDPKAMPRLDSHGGLIIPLNCPFKYRWWQGGQSIGETMAELKKGRKG